jgi:hypothetical protein
VSYYRAGLAAPHLPMPSRGYGTHYVALADELNLDHRPPIVSDRQHSYFRWMTPAELISSPDVHHNTQAYFSLRRGAGQSLTARHARSYNLANRKPGANYSERRPSNDQILRQAAPSPVIPASRPVYLIGVVNRGGFPQIRDLAVCSSRHVRSATPL